MNLISGKEALIALANGENVQYSYKTKPEDLFFKDLTINSSLRIDEIFSGQHFMLRLKPRTITLNGIEVPAPFEPKQGDIFYYLNDDYPYGYMWLRKTQDHNFKFGAWRTEEEIKQVVDALRKVFKEPQQ